MKLGFNAPQFSSIGVKREHIGQDIQHDLKRALNTLATNQDATVIADEHGVVFSSASDDLDSQAQDIFIQQGAGTEHYYMEGKKYTGAKDPSNTYKFFHELATVMRPTNSGQ